MESNVYLENSLIWLLATTNIQHDVNTSEIAWLDRKLYHNKNIMLVSHERHVVSYYRQLSMYIFMEQYLETFN